LAGDQGRIECVDQFRGLAILSMILINYLARFAAVPPFLKHAPDFGFTCADAVAPFFIFIIGLLYPINFQKQWERDGARRTFQRMARRYGLILLIGVVLSLMVYGVAWSALRSGNDSGILDGYALDEGAGLAFRSIGGWGVLQSIGAAGLLGLLFARSSASWRVGVALLSMAILEVGLHILGDSIVLSWAHAGPFGVLGWTAILLLASAFPLKSLGERPVKVVAAFLGGGCVLLCLGMMLHQALPMSKPRVNASYVLFSSGLSAVLFFCFWGFNDKIGVRFPHLTAMGKNPLLLYILHNLVIALIVSVLGSDAAAGWIVFGAVLVYLFCACLATWLDRRAWYLKV